METKTFSSEFIALKTAVEQIEALRYKLRMMGIAIDGSCSIFCDNQAVTKNVSALESTLSKKHSKVVNVASKAIDGSVRGG